MALNREAGWWEGEAADGIIHGGNAPVALSCSKIGPFCFHMALQDLTSHVSSCFLLTDDFPAATGTLCLQNSEDWVPPPWDLALATPIASMTSLPMIASFFKKKSFPSFHHFHHFHPKSNVTSSASTPSNKFVSFSHASACFISLINT